MEKLTIHSGIPVYFRENNIDTDAIIPKQFLKSIKRSGFGDNLFDAWRYLDVGEAGKDCSARPKNPRFVLNLPRYQNATILITNENFGCGSSREHAPWAISDFGVRVLIGKSFADIFYSNCFKNGLLPIILPAVEIEQIMKWVEENPKVKITVDLPQNQVIVGNKTYEFTIDKARKKCLLEGLDDIGITLSKSAKIREFEQAHFAKMPWINSLNY